jgi:hypothetical protein
MGTGMVHPFAATDHISRTRAVATSALNNPGVYKYYPVFCPVVEFIETAYAIKKVQLSL